ncbi:2OG-Fe(II) oxygenase [Undibacterium sp. Jales W-56]|uniref:2OG-Fe(II) oxygenase n=1 Tax=Undibacterium sp. Jales W-56 TaxID=2897325 RepID=UPI0021CEE5CF|nr:2OG-Fe(II) oxygenase [Undibacterium sp. Jales W-56]MCU6433118.1 2OG-Fe(II) oxygenase [Undibacterium sp. Jales W-56]
MSIALKHDDSPSTMPDELINHLVEHGWARQAIFLGTDLTLALAAECRGLSDQKLLRIAKTGRVAKSDTHVQTQAKTEAQFRSDQISWLTAGQSLACDQYLLLMESLRQRLNRDLFLGLDDYESHFAFYAPGAFYAQHRDRFQDDDRRTISVVIYLNQDWQTEQGGALRLHLNESESLDIAPEASSMILFLSASMLHEVLPATRDRLSLAGWFRRR